MFYQTPLPPTSTWELFPNLAVIILIMAVLFGGLMMVWREYKTWARELERTATAARAEQRDWEEEQDEIRDARWQSFLEGMQQQHALESEQDRRQMATMADNIRQLSENSQKLAETVGHLSETLTTHIAVDDARFDVLLTPTQKQAMNEQLAAPRRKKPPL